MINPDIKYSFNQIEKALIGFVGNLELKLQQLVPSLPVFVLQTGDFSYIINKKFIESDNKEIYEKTPRFVINLEDVQYMTDQNSNPYNKYNYVFENEVYQVTMRRLTIVVQLNTDFVSPNFIFGLNNFEVMATIIAKENVFTYEFLGNTIEAAYVMTTPSFEKPTMDVNSGSRNFIVKTGFDLQLSLLVPRIDTIKLEADTNLITKFELQVKETKTKTIHEEDLDFIDNE